MTLVTRGLLHSVWFGFDAERLLVRVDTEGGPARERLAEVDRLRIGFVDPAEREIVVMEPSASHPAAFLHHAGRPVANGTTVAGRHRHRSSSSPCRSRGWIWRPAIRFGFMSSYSRLIPASTERRARESSS